MTNMELMMAFDNDTAIEVVKLNATDEHAAQVMVIEVLRQLNAHWNLDGWNAMSDCTWMNVIGHGCHAATMHPAAMMHDLTWDDMVASANMGGNYFEHGFQTVLDATPQNERVTFSRMGGVQ